jgi:imidazolonepropionase-like amidohydrolase
MYVDNPKMPDDPKYKVAPPWELARLVAARDADLKADQTDAMTRVKDEEDTVAAVLRAGGYILAGTDSPLDLTATSLHLNLRAQVKFGLPPWQALETATILPARALGLSKDLGTLEPGKLADLIIVAGDPLRDINAAAEVQCVMENGSLRSVGSIMAPFVPGNTTGDSVCPSR